MIDIETSVKTIVSHHDKRKHVLVMSDEYNTDDREFGFEQDKIFEAVEKPDDSNQAIEFYNATSEYVTTKNGSLVLITRAVKTTYVQLSKDSRQPERLTKNYTSGMVQSWNKFCFTGGILEMAIDLPGDAHSGGLWSAAWLMGQLSRATFEDTTMNIWPWSYNKCDAKDALNSLATRQKISACQDQPGFGFHPHQGRGAPEIDIFEIMPGHEMPDFALMDKLKKEKEQKEEQEKKDNKNGGTSSSISSNTKSTKPLKSDPWPMMKVDPFMSTSLQISPGVAKGKHRPINGHLVNTSAGQTWYTDLAIPNPTSQYNYWFWGQECGPEHDPSAQLIHKYMEDAISINTNLYETHFNSSHVYRLEWQPGAEGYLEWYLDNQLIFGIPGRSVYELTGAMIPQEPMYIVLNTAISHRWGFPEPCDVEHCSMCWKCFDCMNPECQCTLPSGMKNCKNLPAEFKIDYIRLYQDPLDVSHTTGCSPENYPTAEYIQAHAEKYANWKPYTGPMYSMNNIIQHLVYVIGIFGLCVMIIFGIARVVQLIYRRMTNPYHSVSSGEGSGAGVMMSNMFSGWFSSSSSSSGTGVNNASSGGNGSSNRGMIERNNSLNNSSSSSSSNTNSSKQLTSGSSAVVTRSRSSSGQHHQHRYLALEDDDCIALVTLNSNNNNNNNQYDNDNIASQQQQQFNPPSRSRSGNSIASITSYQNVENINTNNNAANINITSGHIITTPYTSSDSSNFKNLNIRRSRGKECGAAVVTMTTR